MTDNRELFKPLKFTLKQPVNLSRLVQMQRCCPGPSSGKKRLWVITAPSHNDDYLRMMEKQLEDMEQKGLNCRLAERDTFIITIIQNAMMEGRIQKTTFQGDAIVESLDPDTVTKLLHYLELTNQEQGFTMLVMKKNLLVSQRFPYPVRVEAVLELIDHFPMRKLERMTRKGANMRCKTIKKKVLVTRKKMRKKTVPSPQTRGNVTSIVASQKKPPLDKKAALKSTIQDILNGRRRYVIRKEPAVGSTRGKDSISGGQVTSNRQEKVPSPPSVSKSIEEVKKDRTDSAVEEEEKKRRKNSENKKEEKAKEETQEKQSSKKKGKGNKGKKGKGRGKKSNREASEKDKAALKEFLDSLKGARRLMRVFEAPPSSPALLEYIDNFPSRRSEKEKERRSPPICSTDKKPPGPENSLLRFMSKRRLLLISAPSEDDYSFQQQLSALSGQECHLGIRHFAMLKLTGTGDKASGTVELFPLNGRSQSEVEPLPRDTVNNMREQLKISKDYFSMLVVGKDGDVKAWFPSPMWSLDNVYDLVDSMELRLQEEKLQKRLGISCPDDKGRGGSEGERYRGYDEEGAEETYLYHRSEE
ncbi:Coiled-coil domain-containing protein 80 [Collichthys lucidus]|uniref:Coiled-coil domain-containing protein 80 n=1 Tax=Collichthys lucidus TaxID=240159 RepID=A0A4U5V9C7_COLLU|nr:Coiled-coil domain-containing protein 80 [Collichthys lucidus]